MEKIDLILKILVSAVGTFISYLVGGFGLAFTILLGMMLLDYITGIMVGIATKTLSSSVGRNGFIRKMYVIILIAAIYMLSQVAEGMAHIGDGVTIAYIVVEFISITENGGKLGAPMPKIVKDAIAMLKGSDEK